MIRSYLLAYASHSHKDIFNVNEIDLAGIGAAFGFTIPPRVDISFSMKHRSDRAAGRVKMSKKNRFGGTGHSFSASNPYGKRESNDQRQFSR
jgi:ATP-dependent RNA helicase DDX18/HAS1